MTLRCLEGGSWFKMGPFIEWFQIFLRFQNALKNENLKYFRFSKWKFESVVSSWKFASFTYLISEI